MHFYSVKEKYQEKNVATNQIVASCVNTVNTVGQVYVAVTPYTGVSSLAAKQVCLGSVKRTTCTDFVAKLKSRTTL